jgi:alkylation response protein AidB-like acyl-CoA dehydrogenase
MAQTTLDLSMALKRFSTEEAALVPLPGSGSTSARFKSLAAVGKIDLSLARLAEGHLDALAILDEAGMAESETHDALGVWAARSDDKPTRAELRGGSWVLTGAKPFCSGAGYLDRALVTAEAPDGYRLFDVDLRRSSRTFEWGSWQAVGMAASDSHTFVFDDVVVPLERSIGAPNFYLDRAGFWFGASGVAACWFGGAEGLLETVLRQSTASASEHSLAAIGRAHACVASMDALLETETTQIDLDPTDSKGNAQRRALILRQVIHDLCLEVLSLTAEAGGARPLCHDGEQARRAADLFVYLAQHHGNRDAAQLGHILVRELHAVRSR